MPVFLAALIGGFIQAAGTLVGKVLISLGMGYVVYSGLDTGLSWLGSQIQAAASGLGSEVVAIMGALKAGVICNILLSALSARLLLNGLTSGTLKKFVLK